MSTIICAASIRPVTVYCSVGGTQSYGVTVRWGDIGDEAGTPQLTGESHQVRQAEAVGEDDELHVVQVGAGAELPSVQILQHRPHAALAGVRKCHLRDTHRLSPHGRPQLSPHPPGVPPHLVGGALHEGAAEHRSHPVAAGDEQGLVGTDSTVIQHEGDIWGQAEGCYRDRPRHPGLSHPLPQNISQREGDTAWNIL